MLKQTLKKLSKTLNYSITPPTTYFDHHKNLINTTLIKYNSK